MHDFTRNLNDSQRRAVTHGEGPALVIAGAGSGKTRVIEYRVMHLVAGGVPPEAVLLLTFTRRASREMLSRASRHDPRCALAEGGTFHSFGYRVLRRHGRLIGLPDSFTVLDQGDCDDAVSRACAGLGLFEGEKRGPKKETVRAVLSMAVNKEKPVAEVLAAEYPHFSGYADAFEAARKAYEAYKRQYNYLDFDDLLSRLRTLLQDDAARELVSRRYRFIMVDEYQDTNRLQADIACLLAAGHRNIMAVGDDAQSIYGFRGASHQNIMDFPERMAPCEVVTLAENYRSRQAVLDLANAVLETMTAKYEKRLTAARADGGDRPRLQVFRNAFEEAAFVAESVETLEGDGTPFFRQAVLFRSAYVSIPLQTELTRRGVPYRVFGGLRFYETAHVKDVTAHLKVIANPKDELAWTRILTMIPGVGPRTAAKACLELASRATVAEAIKRLPGLSRLARGAAEGLSRLAATLSAASEEGLSVAGRFAVVMAHYEPILAERYDDWHLRKSDLDTLAEAAETYETLEAFLADIAIEAPDATAPAEDAPENERPLTLSTIHSAKGLEWDAVFLLGLADGVLPVSFALNREEEIEEERRLFYVAVTRARDHLALSMHREENRGDRTRYNKVSRFVEAPGVMARLWRGVQQPGGRPGNGPAGGAPAGAPPGGGSFTVYDREALKKKLREILRKR